MPKTQAQKRSGKPPRLSMIYGDELSTDRVHKARESTFMDMSGMEVDSDEFEPPELDDSDESPLPNAIMLKKVLHLPAGQFCALATTCTWLSDSVCNAHGWLVH